jgi:sugar transferase (PEP-CTERM/EpsH1 system associated)
MNILIVSPQIPYPLWGAGTRNYQLLKALAQRHTVSLLSLATGFKMPDDYVAELEKYVRGAFHLFTPSPSSRRRDQLLHTLHGTSYILESHLLSEIQQTIDKLFTACTYDAVLFESSLVAGYSLPRRVKVIIDQHNIEHELLRRTYQNEKKWLRKWYNWREYRLVRAAEFERCRKADAIAVTSERERSILQSELPESFIEVVPNGVDIEYFNGNTLQEVEGHIVFTGSLEYYPNVDAVLSFARNCWPRLRAKLPGVIWQIVGKNPLPEVRRLADLPGVRVFGSVEDTRPYIASSQVAIAPLAIGSGTRLKILEAFAMRKAVVSTSIGCEGLAVEPGKHLLVADQPEAFADAIIDLLGNRERRQALGSAGRSLVESCYSWQQSGDRLLAILDKLG